MDMTLGKEENDPSVMRNPNPNHGARGEGQGSTSAEQPKSLVADEMVSGSMNHPRDCFGFPISEQAPPENVAQEQWEETEAPEEHKPSLLDITADSDTSSEASSASPTPRTFFCVSNERGRRTCLILVGIGLVVGAILAGVIVGAAAFGIGNAAMAGGEKEDTQPSPSPSGRPTLRPTADPTNGPTAQPTNRPSPSPTAEPTTSQTKSPTRSPTESPSESPTKSPTASPTVSPTYSPTATNQNTPVTFVPGDLTRNESGLLLSTGLRARVIGTTGQPVEYHNGSLSEIPFHGRPDYGATFADSRPFNEGGWVYTSNSEMEEEGAGGVGAITFDKNGEVIDYRMVLTNSTMNCGGGATPWGTFVSCEEIEFYGEVYQVDPFGEIQAEKATIGSQLGRWESFAHDVRDPMDPKFFVTEDHNKGTVRRFRPKRSLIDWDSPWDMLHVDGTIDYLMISPNANLTGGTFEWTNDLNAAKSNAKQFYPQTEGIDVYNGQMYVVCKGIRQMFTFDLDAMTYYNKTTVSGLFDGSPDQVIRILDGKDIDLLFFTEEGGKDSGVHARDSLGRMYTIFESPVYPDETTGLAFSPNGAHMYVAYQQTGLLFDIWREDGRAFDGRVLNVKYHKVGGG